MILPPTSTAQYEQIKQYEELAAQHSPTDYGAWRGMAASFQNGMYNNVTMTLGKWMMKNSLADDDANRIFLKRPNVANWTTSCVVRAVWMDTRERTTADPKIWLQNHIRRYSVAATQPVGRR